MSKVGTKNEAGDEVMRSRKLKDSNKDYKKLGKKNERMISGNGMLECKLIAHIVEKTGTSPSQLVHFLYK